MKPVTAADGLLARDSGPWGLTKLSFLDSYCPAAIQATERKLQRYYVDVFAGPGVNVIRGAGAAEYEGSPVRASISSRSMPIRSLSGSSGGFRTESMFSSSPTWRRLSSGLGIR